MSELVGLETSFDEFSVDSGLLTVQPEESYLVANYECHAQYPIDPSELAPLDEREVESLYAYFTLELGPCLERNGVAVSRPPSLTVFSENLNTSAAWSPYRSVPSDGSTDVSDLLRRCPQLPPEL